MPVASKNTRERLGPRGPSVGVVLGRHPHRSRPGHPSGGCSTRGADLVATSGDFLMATVRAGAQGVPDTETPWARSSREVPETLTTPARFAVSASGTSPSASWPSWPSGPAKPTSPFWPPPAVGSWLRPSILQILRQIVDLVTPELVRLVHGPGAGDGAASWRGWRHRSCPVRPHARLERYGDVLAPTTALDELREGRSLPATPSCSSPTRSSSGASMAASSAMTSPRCWPMLREPRRTFSPRHRAAIGSSCRSRAPTAAWRGRRSLPRDHHGDRAAHRDRPPAHT